MFIKKKKLKDLTVGIGGTNEYIDDPEGIFQTTYSSIIDRYNIDLSDVTSDNYLDIFGRFDDKAEKVSLVYGGTNHKPSNGPYMLPAFKGEVQKNIIQAVSESKRASSLNRYIEQSKNRAQGAEVLIKYLECIQSKSAYSTDMLFYALLESCVILAAAPIRENLARIRDIVLGFVTIDADREELITAGKLLEQSLMPLLKILYTANVETLRVQEPILDAVIVEDEQKLAKAAAKKSRRKGAL